MPIPEFEQGLQLIANRTSGSILDVVGALAALAPFLEAVLSNADDKGGAGFVENRVIVIGRERLGLQREVGGRQFLTPSRADIDTRRMSEG